MNTGDTSIPSFNFKKPDPGSLFLASKNGLQTYGELDQYTTFFQRQLQDVKTDLERPVGFIVESCDELIMAVASCWKLGIPFACFNPQAAKNELQAQVDQLKPSVLIVEPKFSSIFESTPTVPLREFRLNKAFKFIQQGQTKTKSLSFDTDPEQVFGYFFTSGTSSTPKIVPLKRRQILFAAEASAGNFQPDPNHFWLLCLPLNHIGGISIIIRSLLYGSGIYRMNKFDKDMVATFLSENKLFQAASLVPTMLKRLIDIPAFQTHKKFKAILLGGGPITPSLLENAVKKGIPVVASYGMTETCAQIAANPFLQPSGTYIPKKSVGKIFKPNEIEIRDDSGQPAGVNTSGTIWLKGPQIFDGYLDNKLNEQVFDDNGWFNTGDFGHLNVNGHLFIESRRSDLIITGGENVSPYEVEAELKKIDSIEDAAVLGLPDEEWGQRVVAAVVTKTDRQFDKEMIQENLNKHLTSFKIPKQILQVEELPTNQTGKVVRNELTKLFEK